MKMQEKITGLRVVETGLFGRTRLEVTCGTTSFQVDDTEVTRKTYAIGRTVHVTIAPDRRS